MTEMLLDQSREEMAKFFISMGQPEFRAEQLMEWIYQHRETDFYQMTNLPKDLRTRLSKFAKVTDVMIEQRLVGKGSEGEKYAFRLGDDEIVEAALMRYSHGTSLCLSTQVGCSVRCPFCASGAEGLLRNLSTAEILSQWLLVQRQLDAQNERISHVVFMGIGEPLHNYDSTVNALRRLHSPDTGAGISYRRMTVSTAGVVPRIRELAGEDMPVTLAVSLHAPNDYLRNRLVPINGQFPLDEVIESCQYYTDRTGRRVTFEYAMIKGVNDHPELARELAILLEGMICHVNLIPMNPVAGTDLSPADRSSADEFAEVLQMMGVKVTIRRQIGSDIDAACGQLRRRLVD